MIHSVISNIFTIQSAADYLNTDKLTICKMMVDGSIDFPKQLINGRIAWHQQDFKNSFSDSIADFLRSKGRCHH